MEKAAAEFGAIGEATVFLDYFKDLPDPRQRGKVVYPLDEVLLLCLLAVLGGAETFVDIARFGEKKLGASAPVPAVSRWNALPRSPRRYFCDARCRGIPALLRRLGCGADRRAGGCDRHRWQDAAPFLPEERRESADPHGFGLRGAPAPRARTGQSGGKIQRNRRHPGAPRHDGDRGRHRDHRRDGLPARHRSENPRIRRPITSSRSKAIKAPCARMSRFSLPSRRPTASRIRRSAGIRRSMAITAASKPEPTPPSMMWLGFRNATTGLD